MATTMTRTVRIAEATHATLAKLAEREARSMGEVLAAAVEAYRRERFFDEADAQLAALRADPVAWAEEEAERALWDTTLMDGLEDEE
jgi:hypothetical protein